MTDLVLFCGAGGATEGLVRAGWNIDACVDSWDKACEAHKRWHPELRVVRARCENVGELFAGSTFDRIWASPSCKPWSTANRTPKRGKAHPEYYSLAKLVGQAFEEFGCRWLVIENVGGLIWSKEGVVEIAELRAAVAKRGLAFSMPRNGVIPSNTLGVAQLRRRVFLIVGPRLVSIRPGSVLLPQAGVGPMLWELSVAEQGTVGTESRPVGRSTRNGLSTAWRRVEKGVVDASNPGRHRKMLHHEHNFAKRLRAQRTAILGSAQDHPNKWGAEYSGAKQVTGRTIAECAALQMVPMSVIAGCTKRDAFTLVGNAVPPPVAEHIGRIVMEADEAEVRSA